MSQTVDSRNVIVDFGDKNQLSSISQRLTMTGIPALVKTYLYLTDGVIVGVFHLFHHR